MGCCERENKICLKNQRGAALLNVLLITTFVMILASTIASMAMTSYRLKLINYGSKENFYKCEAALEQLRVGFKNELNTLKEGSTEATALYAFYERYKNTNLTWVGSESKTSGKGAYNVETLSSLIDNIAGYKVTDRVSNPNKTECVLSFEDESIKVTISTENTESGFVLSTSGVVFSDIKVTYEEDGYQNSITTDIEVGFGEDGSSDGGDSKGIWVKRTGNNMDMVKSYNEWKNIFSGDKNSDIDFNDRYINLDWAEEKMAFINTTDYPVGTVTWVEFSIPLGGMVYGEGWSAFWTYIPTVLTQDANSLGNQYSAVNKDNIKTTCKNVYVYVGNDNWVPYSDVFDTETDKTNKLKDSGESVKQFKEYYKYTDENGNIPNVIYRVKLENDGSVSARGYICIYGDANGTIVEPTKNENGEYENIQIYVEIGDNLETDVINGIPDVSSSWTIDNNGKKAYNSTVKLDLTDCDFMVGDKLVITLNNVAADSMIDFINHNNYDYGPPTSITHNIIEDGSIGSPKWTMSKVDDYTVTITIDITWNIGRYITITNIWTYSNNGQDEMNNISLEWDTSGRKTSETDNTEKSDDDQEVSISSKVSVVTYSNWRQE